MTTGPSDAETTMVLSEDETMTAPFDEEMMTAKVVLGPSVALVLAALVQAAIPVIDLPETLADATTMMVQSGAETMVLDETIEGVREEIKMMVDGDEIMTEMEMLEGRRGRNGLPIRNRNQSLMLSRRKRWARMVGRI